jgi:hypothetical protein
VKCAGRADEISYSSAMKACEEGQFWELALHFLDVLEERRGTMGLRRFAEWVM